jgi:hypothetical protein
LIRGAKFIWSQNAITICKTTVTGVFSEQKSQTKSVVSQWQDTARFWFALDYDNDRHFFLITF